MKLPLTYDNYIFDLYGTLVDIHTDESDLQSGKKLAMFYGITEHCMRQRSLRSAMRHL